MTTERYRIVDDAYAYFVTYSIVEWLPVFVSGTACQIVADSLDFCHREKGLRTNAFVIMPTHMHAIFFDADFNNEQLEQSLTDFRKFTGRALSDFCVNHLPKCFLHSLRNLSPADRHRSFWQATRHPEGIQSETFWRQKLDYIHDNPYRKGLVVRGGDWRYSSARYYVTSRQEDCDVTISAISWD